MRALPARMFAFRLSLCLASVLAGAAQARDNPAALTPMPDFPAAGLSVARAASPEGGCQALSAAELAASAPLDLAALVDLALCRAPQTAAAWASVRAAAEREVQARAAYGPRLDATLGPDASLSRRWGGGFPATTDSGVSATARLSLSWLVTDFGGRAARIDAARANRLAAFASFADRAQAIALETGLAYHAVLATLESVDAARSNLRFAEVSLEAATARQRAGVGIRSDRLQADAAEARARLDLRRAEGDLEVARGRLASLLALPPDVRLPLARPEAVSAGAGLAAAADLIAEADRLRPDLRLAEASSDGARAAARAARAARRPSISLGAGPAATFTSAGSDLASGQAGVTVSIPLFDSGGRTAAVAEADREAERADALYADARLQAALDVWGQYQALATETENLETARRLLASAEEAAALSQGRYKAGLAGVTELLNAQASLAAARQQLVAADYGVRSAQLRLAHAVGRIGEAVE